MKLVARLRPEALPERPRSDVIEDFRNSNLEWVSVSAIPGEEAEKLASIWADRIARFGSELCRLSKDNR